MRLGGAGGETGGDSTRDARVPRNETNTREAGWRAAAQVGSAVTREGAAWFRHCVICSAAQITVAYADVREPATTLGRWIVNPLRVHLKSHPIDAEFFVLSQNFCARFGGWTPRSSLCKAVRVDVKRYTDIRPHCDRAERAGAQSGCGAAVDAAIMQCGTCHVAVGHMVSLAVRPTRSEISAVLVREKAPSRVQP